MIGRQSWNFLGTRVLLSGAPHRLHSLLQAGSGAMSAVSAPGGAAPVSAEEARVLVVDDEEHITELLSTALRYIGHRVDVAHTGREALDKSVSFRPDVVLLDVMLPDVDGFEVCRRLRNDGIAAPVIFLTARDATEDK